LLNLSIWLTDRQSKKNFGFVSTLKSGSVCPVSVRSKSAETLLISLPSTPDEEAKPRADVIRQRRTIENWPGN
jgi:hypothetical protein